MLLTRPLWQLRHHPGSDRSDTIRNSRAPWDRTPH
jgi:hypothetical protein